MITGPDSLTSELTRRQWMGAISRELAFGGAVACGAMWHAPRNSVADEIPPVKGASPDDVHVVLRDGSRAVLAAATVEGGVLAGRGRTLRLADVLRMEWPGHPVRGAPGAPLVVTAAGDRLAMDVLDTDSERARVRFPAFDDWPVMSVPLEQIRGVAWSTPAGERSLLAFLMGLLESAQKTDALLLANGDRLDGELDEVHAREVLWKSAVGDSRLERSAVRGIVFNPELVADVDAGRATALITLSDGSHVHVSTWSLDREGLRGEASSGLERLEVPVSAVSAVRPLGGGIAYLSDLDPVEYRQRPFIGLGWPLGRDRGVTGSPLRLAGTEYPKGLGLHSACEAVYAVPGWARLLHGSVGIDDSAGAGGAALVALVGDGRVIFQSEVLRGQARPTRFGPVDVAGVRQLTVKVDYGPHADVRDHVALAEGVLTG